MKSFDVAPSEVYGVTDWFKAKSATPPKLRLFGLIGVPATNRASALASASRFEGFFWHCSIQATFALWTIGWQNSTPM